MDQQISHESCSNFGLDVATQVALGVNRAGVSFTAFLLRERGGKRLLVGTSSPPEDGGVSALS